MLTLRHAWSGPVELVDASGTGHRFAKHSHDECVIGVNLEGEEHIWLDGRMFNAGKGSITLYNPGQIQGGGAHEGAFWRYVGLYVSADWLAQSLGVNQVEFERPLLYQPAIANRFACVVQMALRGSSTSNPHVHQALVLLLAEITELSGVALIKHSAEPEVVLRIQECLADSLAQMPTLDELALLTQRSKYQLLRAFQKETGLSPHQWAMQLRTRRARGLLRQGMPATDVAYTLGFADQSHLSRHFRSAYGIPPGQYQRLYRSCNPVQDY